MYKLGPTVNNKVYIPNIWIYFGGRKNRQYLKMYEWIQKIIMLIMYSLWNANYS